MCRGVCAYGNVYGAKGLMQHYVGKDQTGNSGKKECKITKKIKKNKFLQFAGRASLNKKSLGFPHRELNPGRLGENQKS